MASEDGISVPVTADTSQVETAMARLIALLKSVAAVAAETSKAAGAAAKTPSKPAQPDGGKQDSDAAEKAAQRTRELEQAIEATDEKAITQAQKLGEISISEELTARQNLATAVYDLQKKQLESVVNNSGAEVNARNAALQQEEMLTEKYHAKMLEITGQSVEREIAELQSYFAPLEASFTKSISGMISGTTNFHKAVSEVGQSIVSDAVSHAVKWASTWAEQELATAILHQQVETEKSIVTEQAAATRLATEDSSHAAANILEQLGVVAKIGAEGQKTGAVEVGAASRAATEEAASSESIALSVATGIKDIAVKAAQAAAGAYSAIAAIPVVGPVLAPVAAAAALAAVVELGRGIASAEGGWDQVPEDQIAQLHKNEMVLPASIAGPLRDTIAGTGGLPGYGLAASPSPGAALSAASAGSAASGASAGPLHVHYAPTVQAMDATGIDRVLRDHGNSFVRYFQNAHRNGGLKTGISR